MIQKKICMLGAFAVGKTSMVARFVQSIFSDKYHTTVGVKIDKKLVTVGDQQVSLLLWDLAGEDELHTVQTTYLRGAAGYLLVVDGTRKSTLDTALMLRERVRSSLGDIPYILVINKSDLIADWQVDAETISALTGEGITLVTASAKLGQGVEEAFRLLTDRLLRPSGG